MTGTDMTWLEFAAAKQRGRLDKRAERRGAVFTTTVTETKTVISTTGLGLAGGKPRRFTLDPVDFWNKLGSAFLAILTGVAGGLFVWVIQLLTGLLRC